MAGSQKFGCVDAVNNQLLLLSDAIEIVGRRRLAASFIFHERYILCCHDDNNNVYLARKLMNSLVASALVWW